LFSRKGRRRPRVSASSQPLYRRSLVAPLVDSPLSDAPAESGGGAERIRRMERGGASSWHGTGSGRGLSSGGRFGYPNEEEECFGGGEYQWSGRGFDPGYGGAGPGGRARGWPRRGLQPRGGRGGGSTRGGLARRPSRGSTSRGARFILPRGGASSRPGLPQQPAQSEESRKLSGEASLASGVAQVSGGTAQQPGSDASAGDGHDTPPMQPQGEREAARHGGKPRICTRCSLKGHATADCQAEIHCDICDAHGNHVNHRCPILKLPRPVAHAVGYSVEGLGFYHIPHPPPPLKEEGLQDGSHQGGRRHPLS
jgi:hypothetical protein